MRIKIEQGLSRPRVFNFDTLEEVNPEVLVGKTIKSIERVGIYDDFVFTIEENLSFGTGSYALSGSCIASGVFNTGF
jgi:hypothetical protein